MTNRERLDRIGRFVRERHYVDLHSIAERFGISLSTVRRALNELESRGEVRRHHGGASWIDREATPRGYDFIAQDDRHSDAKHAIAEHIAQWIEPGMTVILDGGTTTYALARVLVARRIVVITNSLPIAALFSEVGSSETLVTGGTVYARLGILYGPTCEDALEKMHADIAVMGGAGMTRDGIWSNNNFIPALQTRMRRAADRACYALDASKCGRRALNLATPFEPDFEIVTNGVLPNRIHEACREAGCLVRYAASPTPTSEPSHTR